MYNLDKIEKKKSIFMYQPIQVSMGSYRPVQIDTNRYERYEPIQNSKQNKNILISLNYRNKMYDQHRYGYDNIGLRYNYCFYN